MSRNETKSNGAEYPRPFAPIEPDRNEKKQSRLSGDTIAIAMDSRAESLVLIGVVSATTLSGGDLGVFEIASEI